MDVALVDRAAAGDAEAFEELIRLAPVYRLCVGLLANQADAADATQEALVAAWRQLPRLRDPESFDPWLRRIACSGRTTAVGPGRRCCHTPRPRRQRQVPRATVGSRAARAAGRRLRRSEEDAMRSRPLVGLLIAFVAVACSPVQPSPSPASPLASLSATPSTAARPRARPDHA